MTKPETASEIARREGVTPQAIHNRKRLERGAVRVIVTLDPVLGDSHAIATWNALVALHGGPKAALLAALGAGRIPRLGFPRASARGLG